MRTTDGEMNDGHQFPRASGGDGTTVQQASNDRARTLAVTKLVNVSVYSDDNTAPCNVEEKSSALCLMMIRTGAMRFGEGEGKQRGECSVRRQQINCNVRSRVANADCTARIGKVSARKTSFMLRLA